METLFRCRYCHKACNNSLQLEKHERTHQEETVVTCRGCGEHFESKDLLARHPCTGSDKGNFCAKTHATDTELQEHEQGHLRGVEKFQCKLCNCNFDMVHDLQRHLEMHNHTNKYIYMCPKCSKRFESKLSLECHLQEHEEVKSGSQDPLRVIPSNDAVDITGSTRLETFFCNVCGQTFNREGQFRQHLDGHFQRNLYECDICNSRFAGPFLLQHHMEVHSSARPFVCSQCGTGYRQKELLMKHFKIHGVPKMDNRDQLQEASSKQEVKQTGVFISHEESDASALIDKKVNQHLDSDGANFFDLLQTCNSEDSESIFWASQAGKDDFTKINPVYEDLLSQTALQNEQLHPKQLRENSLPMSGEGGDQSPPLVKMKGKRRKSFPCDICNKVFKFKSHCQRHRRIHTGEMPFKCGVCGRKFRWRSSLVTHACLKYRGKDKPSTSDISLVHSAEHLNDHQQGHSGECVPEVNGHGEVTQNANDGFVCSLCGGNCATEILLQSHTCVLDGRKSDPPTSEIQMQWQSDRVDPAKRSVVVSSTMPTENSQSILPMTGAGTNQTSDPAVGVVQQKQLQGSRKWGISWKTRQPRVSTPSANTAVTSHPSAVKERNKVFACEFCYKVFLCKNKYLRHKRLHTGEKPFECVKCNRRFMWASSLASHKKTHEKRDLHVYATNHDVISVIDSEQSDEATLEQSGWIPEVKEERGLDKAFICGQCGKSFTSEHKLRCHASVHEVHKYFSRSAPRTDTGLAQVSYRAKDVTQKSNVEPKHKEKCHTRKPEGTTSETGVLSRKRNRRQFVCEYCNKVFNHRSRYVRHLPIHTGEMAYQCSLCHMKFKWRSSLDSHKKSHDKKKGGTSSDDSLPFIDAEKSGELMQEQPDGTLEENEGTVGDEMFICLVCGMDFDTEMQLQSHNSTHEDTKYDPISVPRTDTDVAQLSGRAKEAPKQNNPENSKGNEKPHTGRIGNPLETDKFHKQKKIIKNFECEVCSKVFHIKNNYHRHKLLHTEEKPFQCDQCEKAFKWGSSLDSHIKSHNKKKGPTSSSDYVSLIANELTQEHSEPIPGCSQDEKSASTSLKPFVCPQCGMDYVSDLELQIHMYIHGDEAYLQRVQTKKRMDGTDPEKIDRPVMQTTQRPTANVPPHQVHEPESRGIRSTEKSGTSGSTTLERGTMQKQTSKNYVCEICGKSFGSSNHYRRHMPLHTGEVPYECERCNKKFKWRSSLDSHRRSHARKDALTDV
ncbi:zinc finger protein 91-like [Strongylocentrotus purpuratus]|uniref:C2H2-type domain-containing protein n=1 Tax=Strongylocentrotus purpuratus TaxID=7668 RepID=A0A7M7NEJ0_STRPU|nr:zinc finger protein 91-like [Strongylocentrotus purpuratus]XP_030835479.1 zinc finger protein 91-like [Strongylocentrotus purpuratus]XP_030835486.1 zinc finger protein 91-like [Strongylocentrotus purpuratus]